MKFGKHPHLQAEKLLHLLRLLGIKATIKPLKSVGISVRSQCGYTYAGILMHNGVVIEPGTPHLRRPLIFMQPTIINTKQYGKPFPSE